MINPLTLAKTGLLALTLSFAAGCSQGAGPAASPSQPSIVVVGRGEAHAKPNIATINLGVEARAATVAEAMQRNSSQMAQLIATLKGAGVAEKDIQTSNFNVRFEREPVYPPPPYGGPMAADAGPAIAPAPAPAPAGGPKAAKPPPPPKGPQAGATAAAPAPRLAPSSAFVVSNNVQIVVRDVAQVGPVIDAAAGAGSNNIWGVNFELDKKDAVEADLRQKAVADAKSRAEALAKLSGVELGPVISVSEVISGRDGPPMPMPMAYAAGKAADSTPIESGQMTFNGQVQVVYAIKK